MTSFLPHSPPSESLSGEILQELGRNEAAAKGRGGALAEQVDDDYASSSNRESILFPSHPIRNGKGRARSTSASSAPPPIRLEQRHSTSSGLDQSDLVGGYGYGGDDREEEKSIRIGGSRPPSPGDSLRQSRSRSQLLKHSHKPSSTISFADTDYGATSDHGRASQLGYLHLQNTPERHAILHQQAATSYEAPTTGAAARKMSANSRRRRAQKVGSLATNATADSNGAVPPLPESMRGSVYGGTEALYEQDQEEDISTHLDSHQAWYLLRALVGEELAYEVDQLWRLTSLDALDDAEAHDRTDSGDINPGDVPILRYLLKHFLLTMPLIRDVGSVISSTGSEVPLFWAGGVQVLIRKLHDADLSQPIDRSEKSAIDSNQRSPVHNAVERFISAGLKLSNSDSRRGDYVGTVLTPLLGVPGPTSFSGNSRPNSQITITNSGANGNGNGHGNGSANAAAGTVTNGRPPSTKSNRFSFGFLPSRSGNNSTKHSPKDSNKSPTSSPSSSPILANSTNSTSDGPSTSRLQKPPSKPAPLSKSQGRPLSPIPNSPMTDITQAFSPPPDTPSSFVSLDNGEFKGVNSALPRSASRQTGATGKFSGLEDGASFVSARSRGTKATTIGSPNSFVEGEEGEMRGLGFDREVPPPLPTDSPWFPWSEDGGGTGSPQQHYQEQLDAQPYIVDDTSTPSASPTFPISSTFVDDTTRPLPPRTSSKNALKSSSSASASPISIPATNANTAAPRKKFGFASLLKSKTSPKSSVPPSPPTSSPEVSPEIASSRKIPTPSPKSPSEPWVAAMTLPSSVPIDSSPVRSAPLAMDLLPKAGMSWPFGAPVPFWRGAPYQQLKWGGFEADIVGVRSTLFSHSFIIRVRRPKRLDEYVLRNETQFMKYFKVLEKQFPAAHIRRIPTSAKDDSIVPPKASLNSPSVGVGTGSRPVSSVAPSDAGLDTFRSSKSTRSRVANAIKEAADDPNLSTATSATTTTTPPSDQKRASSPFASKLRAQSIHGDPTVVARTRRNTLNGPPRPYSMQSHRSSTTSIPYHLTTSYDMKRLPPHDAQRRALRNWLRDTLSVRTVGHHKETAAFLLLGSVLPKESDFKDIRIREMIDDSRRATRVAVAQGSAERARTIRLLWTTVEEECIHGDGFVGISEAIRDTPSIEKLPARYQKSVEWMRTSFAETIHEMLVAGPNSGTAFSKLKSLHASFPYFLVRQAFKLPKSSMMAKVLQDILLARPFGSKSLLQKILATTLEDDPTQTMNAVNTLRTRIGSPTMTEKLDVFCYSEREDKQIIRDFANDNNLELVLCIVRGSDEPRLSASDLSRVVQAGKTYRAFLKTKPTALAKAQNTDPHIRLVMDLQLYLRTVSRDRDATVIRQMLGDDATAQALEVVAAPFVEFIKRVYKVGNGAQALADLQKFLDQLIVIVEALRSRVQEPQKSVRILARLLARHQQPLWDFLRNVHRHETLVEEFLQWGWTASVFLRRGLAQTVDLDSIIPQDDEDQSFFFEELNELTDYHKKKRTREYQNACRRYAGDVDADDPIIIEGDGKGKSKVEPHLEPKRKRPILREIPYCTEAFRDQLKSVFAV